MILDNDITVKARPDEVFTLLNEVERVVACLPGASISGHDGDTYQGGVKVKVGPVSAAYAGTVRFLEVDHERRHLRLQARGADTRGNGDAEAEVELTAEEAPDGTILRLHTDLLIRGKIAQFGKGVISAVSNKLLGQFAANLADLLELNRTGTTQTPVTAVPMVSAAPSQVAELDGLAMLVGPSAGKYLALAGAFAFGVFEGWLLGRLSAQAKLLKSRSREDRRG